MQSAYATSISRWCVIVLELFPFIFVISGVMAHLVVYILKLKIREDRKNEGDLND